MQPEHDDNNQEKYNNMLNSWIVEYIVENNGNRNHHLSIFTALDRDEIHHELLKELQSTYFSTGTVEVTVLRIEQTNFQIETEEFGGIYAP